MSSSKNKEPLAVTCSYEKSPSSGETANSRSVVRKSPLHFWKNICKKNLKILCLGKLSILKNPVRLSNENVVVLYKNFEIK